MSDGKASGKAGRKTKRNPDQHRRPGNQEFARSALDATGVPDNPNLNYLKQATSITPTDLAVIAANIGTGLDNPDHLAVRALALWESCARAIVNWPALKLAQICATLPQPKRYPVMLPDFLKLMMPGYPSATRLKLFRRFLADHYRTNVKAEIDRLQSDWSSPISENRFFALMMRSFLFTEWFKLDLATREWIIDKLESVSPKERAEVLSYLEEQAAITMREGCSEASRRWAEFAVEVDPLCTTLSVPYVPRQGTAAQQDFAPVAGNHKP